MPEDLSRSTIYNFWARQKQLCHFNDIKMSHQCHINKLLIIVHPSHDPEGSTVLCGAYVFSGFLVLPSCTGDV